MRGGREVEKSLKSVEESLTRRRGDGVYLSEGITAHAHSGKWKARNRFLGLSGDELLDIKLILGLNKAIVLNEPVIVELASSVENVDLFPFVDSLPRNNLYAHTFGSSSLEIRIQRGQTSQEERTQISP